MLRGDVLGCVPGGVFQAGAEVLFEDPEERSTSVGITIYPVRVASLEQFGRLEDVGERLLQAEMGKVGGCSRGSSRGSRCGRGCSRRRWAR